MNEKVSKKIKRPLVFLLAGVVLILFALLLAVLPLGMEVGIERWLLQAGAVSAEVEDVDFNVFTGRLILKSVHVEGRDKRELNLRRGEIGVAWRPLLKHRFRVEKIVLEEGQLEVARPGTGALVVAGLVFEAAEEETEPVAPAEPSEPWQWGVDEVELRDVSVRYQDPKVQEDLRIDRFLLQNLASWKEEPTPFDLRLSMRQGTLEIKGKTRLFTPEKDLKARLNIEALPLDWIGPFVEEHKIAGLGGVLNSQMEVETALAPAGSLEVKTEGNLALSGLKGQFPGGQVHEAGIGWDGKVDLNMHNGAVLAAADGDLSGQDLDVAFSEPSYRIKQKKLTFDGRVDFDSEKGLHQGLNMAGELKTAALQVDDSARQKNLLTLEGLSLAGVNLAGIDRIEAGKVKFSELQFLERSAQAKEGHVARLAACEVEKVNVQAMQKKVALGSILLEDAGVHLVRDAQGRLEVLQLLGTSTGPSQNVENSSAAAPPKVQVGRIALKGKNRIVFEDHSVQPSFRQEVHSLELEVSDLNSETPQKASPVELRAGIGNYGTLHVDGTIKPWAERPTMDLKGTLEALDLPPLSPYADRYLDYLVKKGHLDADIHWKVDGGMLDSDVTLLLGKLELASTDGNGKFSQLFGMPANTALSVLRDRQDNIRLHLPIKGDLESPDFRLGDVFMSATHKALQKGAVSYFAPLGVTLLTGVVLPPGTLFVAGKMVQWATSMRFKPVIFASLKTELDAAGKDYLDQVAVLMKERPSVRLVLCGKAVQEDLNAMRQKASKAREQKIDLSAEEKERLFALAKKRALAVKDYLVEKGLEAKNLLICTPTIVLREKEAPVVEISL